MESMLLHRLRKSLRVSGIGMMRFHAYHQRKSFEKNRNFADERIAGICGITAIAGVTFVEIDGFEWYI